MLDKFNQEIKVGHVLANGGRDGCQGIIRVGIVRGFSEKSILADMIVPVYGNTITWKTKRGSFRVSKLCLITGIDANELLDSINGVVSEDVNTDE